MKYFRILKDYIVRLGKIGLSPHEIALGVAVGIFVAFIPLFGTHTITAIVLASLLRVNTLIVLLGTQISNPLTLPVQLLISAEVGSVVLHGEFLKITSSYELSYLLSHYLLPIIVGGLILGIVGSGISYVLIKGFFHRKQNDTA